MKRTIIYILVLWVLIYLLMAFAQASFDVRAWSEPARTFTAFVGLIAAVLSFLENNR